MLAWAKAVGMVKVRIKGTSYDTRYAGALCAVC